MVAVVTHTLSSPQNRAPKLMKDDPVPVVRMSCLLSDGQAKKGGPGLWEKSSYGGKATFLGQMPGKSLGMDEKYSPFIRAGGK